MIKAFLLTMLYIFVIYDLSAQFFTNLDYRDGLSMDHVTHIVQDSLGYMWFGGHNGLVRYDSQKFDYFESIPQDSTTVSHNDITELYPTPNGNIWVSTHPGGLNYFDRTKETFKRYFYDPETSKDPKIMPFHCMYIDRNQRIWVGSQYQGLGYLSRDKKEVIFPNKNQLNWKLRDIIPDPEHPDSIYVSSGYQLGICSIKTGKCRTIKVCNSNLDIWNNMVVDKEGIIWSARFLDGLSSYNPKSNTVEHYLQPNSQNTNILLDEKGCIWVGTHGLGLKIFDTKTKKWRVIHATGEHGSLISDYIESMYKSKDGTIWVGTDRGVSYLDPDDQFIRSYRINIPGTQRPYFVHSYFGTEPPIFGSAYHKPPIWYSKRQQKYVNIPQEKDDFILYGPHQMIHCGKEIFLFYRNGIGVYDPVKMLVKRYRKGKYFDLIEKEGFSMVAKTDSDMLLFSKPPNLLFLLDPQNGVIDSFHIGNVNKSRKYSRSIFYQNEHAIWMEMDNHLVKYDMVKRSLHVYNEKPLSTYFSNIINDILVDNQGVIWVATWKDGLLALEEKNGKLVLKKQYTTVDGLANIRLDDLVCRDDGTLFGSSSTGLSIYNRGADKFIKYTTKNGLLDNRIISLTLDGDSLVIGHEGGYSKMWIGGLNKYRKPVQPTITSVFAGNMHIVLDSDDTLTKIRFPYNKNDVSIHFNAINYSNPQAVEFQFMLDGEHHWKKGDRHEQIVNYPDLNSGHYRFLVRAKNETELWSDPSILKFDITPPYWKTWWFLLLAGLVFVGLIYGILSWRISQEKEKQSLLRKYDRQIANLELKALRSQMNPHFMFNSLNSIKNYIQQNKKEIASEYLSNFSHLIRLILQNSREKLIPLSKEIEMLELYLELEKMRFGDSFEVHCDIDENIEPELLQIPPMILQPHIENAIWHGLMHKESNRRLDVRFNLINDSLQCEIEDNGIGRTRARELKSKTATKYKSMGLGITNDRIELINSLNSMDIKMKIIDKVDNDGNPQGTLVVILIPYKNETLNMKKNILI